MKTQIAGLVSLALLPLCPTLSSAQPAERAALDAEVKRIFSASCFDCHSLAKKTEKNLDLSDFGSLIQSKKLINEAAPEASKLYTKVRDDEMPPQDDKTIKKPLLKPAEKEAILKWIKAVGTDRMKTPAVSAPFIPTKVAVSEMFKKLLDADDSDRPFLRYLTLTVQYNAGDSEEELKSYRAAIRKLLNSLSRRPRIAEIPSFGTGQTLLQLDLRAIGWTSNDWNYLVAQYPYGVDPNLSDSKMLLMSSGASLIHLRADWFAFAATQPQHYHRLLQLPQTVSALEHSLDIDSARNIRELSVVRGAVGARRSGVSDHNRLVERHEIGRYKGAYWKSYDFGASTGKQNVLDNPLGPGNGAVEFQHDGGEIIFNLPNGLQAYLLADAKGNRIDEGPQNIVNDRSAFSGTSIQNGISCIKCHAPGMLPIPDEVRLRLDENPASYPADRHKTIAKLFPGNAALSRLLDQDKSVYRDALKQAEVNPDVEEPITRLVQRFLRPVTMSVAHAEVELPAKDFQQRVAQSLALAGIRHDLTNQSVAREQWIAQFRTIVRELGLGTLTGPEPVGTPAIVAEVSRGGSSTVALNADIRRITQQFDDALAEADGIIRHKLIDYAKQAVFAREYAKEVSGRAWERALQRSATADEVYTSTRDRCFACLNTAADAIEQAAKHDMNLAKTMLAKSKPVIRAARATIEEGRTFDRQSYYIDLHQKLQRALVRFEIEFLKDSGSSR